CVNELTDLKCNKRRILEQLVVVLHPYAPHITEELWTLLGHEAGTLSYASYPKFEPDYLVESEFAYPISVNGKMKINKSFALDMAAEDIEKALLMDTDILKYLDGKPVRKVIYVKGRIINIVI